MCNARSPIAKLPKPYVRSPASHRKHGPATGDRRSMQRSATDKLHCEWLDLRWPSLEAQVAQARADQKGQAELALYQARLQSQDLRC
jgi:hypothetical protein